MESIETSGKVCHVYIADGLTKDIDKLLKAFVKSESLRYETFVEIWKDMKFYHIFQGRPSVMEVREFAEEAIHLGKTYLTDLKNSYVIRVGALYILYGMVYTQPFTHDAKIRIVASECPAIEQLIAWSREEQHYDVLYVWGRILVDGFVQFHLAEREYGAERSLRKYYESGRGSIASYYKRGTRREYSVLTDLLEGGGAAGGGDLPVSWSDLDKLSLEYHKEKCKLNDAHQRRDPPRGLDYANANLPMTIKNSIQRLLKDADTDAGAEQGLQSTDTNLEERRIEIKKRGATAKIVQPRHHISLVHTATSSNSEPRGNSSEDCEDTTTKPNQEETGNKSDKEIVYVIEVEGDSNDRTKARKKRLHHGLGIAQEDCNEIFLNK